MIDLKNLSQAEVEFLINGLRKSYAMEVVEELVTKVRNQAIPQILAAQAAEMTEENKPTVVEDTPAVEG